MGKGTWFQLLPLLGLPTRKSAGASSLRDLAWVRNVLARWHLQPGFKLWFHPDPRRWCSKFLNLNGWTAFCIPRQNYLIMASRTWQRGANCPLCPGQMDGRTDGLTTDNSALEKLHCVSVGGAKKQWRTIHTYMITHKDQTIIIRKVDSWKCNLLNTASTHSETTIFQCILLGIWSLIPNII